MKQQTCKYILEDGSKCLSPYHSAMFHKPKKPLKRTAIKRVTKFTDGKVKITAVVSLNKPKKKKAPSRKKIVKDLDDIFSLFIRLSAADENGNVYCVTSGAFGHWKTMHAGHFYTRGRYPTRWDETNVHVQSVHSNIFLKGDYIRYTTYMIDRYGREYIDELERKSLSSQKFTTPELKEKIEYYKGKVAKLQNRY